MRLIHSAAGLCMMLLACSVHTEAYGRALCFEPGLSRHSGCRLEITDHTGVERSSGGNTLVVKNPETPYGPRRAIRLKWATTDSLIEECIEKLRRVSWRGASLVTAAKKVGPGELYINGRGCKLDYGSEEHSEMPGAKPDLSRLGEQDDPRLGELGQPRLGKQHDDSSLGKQHDPIGFDIGPIGDGSDSLTNEPGDEFSGCGLGDVPASTSCSVSTYGWQTVTNTLSEAHCNLGHTDSDTGPGQLVRYDNTYTVTCVNGDYRPGVYLGETRNDSNWGAYVSPSETCKMKTGPRPSDGTYVIETIVCPAP